MKPQIQPQTRAITLDGQLFIVSYRASGVDIDMFVPKLYPAKFDEMTQTYVFNPVVLNDAEAGTWKMYALLMDGEPCSVVTNEVPAYRPKALLQFTDKYLGEDYLIPWQIHNGLPRAATPILSCIKPEDLAAQGITYWEI